MSRFLLTIAIPTYNRADLLDLCLGRFFDQLGPHAGQVEVLVSNNASTDHTRTVVEKYQARHPQLGYFENEVNGGPDFNIARCFELATARYVWVFSDDDVILPGALGHVISLLGQYEVGVLLTKPHFYHDSVHEFVPDVGPLGYKLYDNAMELAASHHMWLTYISGTIVNKDLVLGLDTLYGYPDSFMIQLGWVLPALVRARQNVEVTTPLVLARALRVLDFRLFFVFGVSYPRVLTSLAARGEIPVAMKDLLIDLLIKIYFGYYVRNGNKGTASHHREQPLLILGKAFWKYKAFWLVLVPGFLRRAVIDALKTLWLITRKIIVAVSGKISKVLARMSSDLQADLAAKSFKRFGTGAQLPVVHTVVNPQCVEVGLGLQALSPFVIEARTWQGGEHFAPTVIIGDRVRFGSDCRLDCCRSIRIGNWVLIGHRVLITDNELDASPEAVLGQPPANRRLLVQGPVDIGDHVLIEDGVRILSGVRIGQNTIIRADAVVRESMPANAVVAGNPAMVVDYLEK